VWHLDSKECFCQICALRHTTAFAVSFYKPKSLRDQESNFHDSLITEVKIVSQELCLYKTRRLRIESNTCLVLEIRLRTVIKTSKTSKTGKQHWRRKIWETARQVRNQDAFFWFHHKFYETVVMQTTWHDVNYCKFKHSNVKVLHFT